MGPEVNAKPRLTVNHLIDLFEIALNLRKKTKDKSWQKRNGLAGFLKLIAETGYSSEASVSRNMIGSLGLYVHHKVIQLLDDSQLIQILSYGHLAEASIQGGKTTVRFPDRHDEHLHRKLNALRDHNGDQEVRDLFLESPTFRAKDKDFAFSWNRQTITKPVEMP